MASLERISKRRRGPDERRHHCACSGNAPPLPPFFFRRSRPIAPGACHGGGWAPRKSEGEYRPARDYTRLRPNPWRRSRDPGPLSIREKIGRGRSAVRAFAAQQRSRRKGGSERSAMAKGQGQAGSTQTRSDGEGRGMGRHGPLGALLCFFFLLFCLASIEAYMHRFALRALGPLLAGAKEPFMARASLTYLYIHTVSQSVSHTSNHPPSLRES